MRSSLMILLLLSIITAYAQEKILYNGTIYTQNSLQPKAEAVAIKDDRIIAVGDLAFVKSKVGRKAQMIDLGGKFLLPGLIDSHNHAISGGETLESAMLNDVLLSKDELKQFAASTLQSQKGMRGDVLYIGGFHSGTWANVAELDELFNNDAYRSQAVVLRGSDGHTAWINAVMLKRAKIDKAYVQSLSDEDRKYFGVDDKGLPNGLISEDGFGRVRAVLPSNKIDINHAGQLGVQHLNSLGITAWLDPSTGDISEGDNNGELNVYKKLSREKKLTAHVVGMVVADGNGNVNEQVQVIRKLQEQFKDVKDVEIYGFKIFADGVLEYPTQTAAISEPYKNSGQTGSLMFDPVKFKNFVSIADKEKLIVHIHAIGDRAVTESLDAYVVARKANGNSGITHSITHLQLVKPSDFPRFAELNVMASSQLLWATADMYTIELVNPYIAESLAAHQYPALSLLKAGTVIAGASDWPVSSANPFEAICTAEKRAGKMGILDEEEIMPRVEMLKAYTINAARLMMKDKSFGSIEAGKQADFVLVDRDVMNVSPDEIKTTQVLWTMFGGVVVFKKLLAISR